VRPVSRRCLSGACIGTGFGPAGYQLGHGPDQDAEARRQRLRASIHGSRRSCRNVGGNVGAFIGADGIAIVDVGYASAAPKLEAALKAISDKPITYLLNTHWHGDHTEADRYFGRTAIIVAHEIARKKMQAGTARFPASPAVALPRITFDDRITLHMNGGDIRACTLTTVTPTPMRSISFPAEGSCRRAMTSSNWPIPGFPAIEQDTDGTGVVDGQIAALEYILCGHPRT
jgi:hypothetical protein